MLNRARSRSERRTVRICHPPLTPSLPELPLTPVVHLRASQLDRRSTDEPDSELGGAIARSLALQPAVRAAPSIEAGRCEMTLGTFSASSVRRAPVRCGPPCPPRSAAAASPSRARHAPRSAIAVLPERIRRSEKRRRDCMRNAPALTSSSSRSIFQPNPLAPAPPLRQVGAQAKPTLAPAREARGHGARGHEVRAHEEIKAKDEAPFTLRRADTEGSSRARRGRSPAEARGDRVSPAVLSFYVRGCRGSVPFINLGVRAGFDTTRRRTSPNSKCPNAPIGSHTPNPSESARPDGWSEAVHAISALAAAPSLAVAVPPAGRSGRRRRPRRVALSTAPGLLGGAPRGDVRCLPAHRGLQVLERSSAARASLHEREARRRQMAESGPGGAARRLRWVGRCREWSGCVARAW